MAGTAAGAAVEAGAGAAVTLSLLLPRLVLRRCAAAMRRRLNRSTSAAETPRSAAKTSNCRRLFGASSSSKRACIKSGDYTEARPHSIH